VNGDTKKTRQWIKRGGPAARGGSRGIECIGKRVGGKERGGASLLQGKHLIFEREKGTNSSRWRSCREGIEKTNKRIPARHDLQDFPVERGKTKEYRAEEKKRCAYLKGAKAFRKKMCCQNDFSRKIRAGRKNHKWKTA